MAHARRMFNDALDNNEVRASYALQEIQKLYTIERTCKEQGLNVTQIKSVRQEKSVPILTALGLRLQHYIQVLLKSPIGKPLLIALKDGNDYQPM